MEHNLNERIKVIETSAVVGLITRNLIHDMTNPLSGLEGILKAINSKKTYDERLMSLAFESIEQMKMIIFETRDLINGKDISQKINVSDNISSILRILEIDLNKYNIEISFEPKEQFFILGMKGLLMRILINLIVNSIEELKQKKAGRKISITLEEIDNKIVVSIRDNGKGISLKHIEKIFMENFTLKKSYLNLGLGLPFVKSTIENEFKGAVAVRSEVGKFTEFILLFPHYQDTSD